MKITKEKLKSYFKKGDKPTEDQFSQLIDSIFTKEEAIELFKKEDENKEYSYQELKNLIDTKNLIVGKKYILSDYQTKYYIEGTNSSIIEKVITNQSIFSNYGFFPTPLTDLVVGFSIEVMSLPNGYSGNIKIGDITTVYANYEDGYYLKFANGLHLVIGSTFKYKKQRYSNLRSEDTVLDSNSKPIVKPGGIVNTEVHDGTPYMQMSAIENPTVPIEKICLTAISNCSFSTQAESITFPGELLEYYFTDSIIKNEDNIAIGTRNGFITRRISKDKKIDINKDWRVQRYRRYKLSDTDWSNYILSNATDHSLYNLNDINSCTLANIKVTESHRYIAPYIENINFFQDFTNLGTIPNPFLTGTTAPSIVYGAMMEAENNSIYKHTVSISLVNNGKDYFIFPQEQLNSVKSIKINNLENTVILNLSSQLSQNNVIDIKITDGVSLSTFISGGTILSASENKQGLIKITTVDSIILNNKGSIESLCTLTTSEINNNGNLNSVTIGGMASNATSFGGSNFNIIFDPTCQIRNTIFGGKRADRLFFNNVQTNKCLFSFSRGQYLKFSNSLLYLTAFKFRGDFYSNLLSLDTTKLNTKKNNLSGYLYEVPENLSGQKIFTNTNNDLVYENYITEANGTSTNRIITLLTLSK
ncbi:hypothetical protein V3468_03350 [Flavobacterium oreochromis]|uniref:hypothetical protein n=1 Tax=Flavobacterium oreochromis TaxID=2906078 RepID=UPI00385AF249